MALNTECVKRSWVRIVTKSQKLSSLHYKMKDYRTGVCLHLKTLLVHIR